jgi:hypothetical protein
MIIAFFIRNLSDDFFVDDAALLFWFLAGTGLAIAPSSDGHPGSNPALK